jgi:diguanylate cyclase (GGDEF)-like protein
LTHATVRTLGILAIPAGALFLLRWFNFVGANLPAPFTGFEFYGPYAALGLAGFMSLWFNRGRALLALLCLAMAQLAYGAVLIGEIESGLAAQSYVALCVLVPVNLAALALLPERGLFNAFGLRRFFLIVAQATALVLLLRAGYTQVADWLAASLPGPHWLQAGPIPLRVLPIIAVSILAAAVPAVLRDNPIEGALCGAIVAFALACYSAEHPADFGLLMSTAALLIMIGVLQDSYRMAFCDELTGLPSRRALNERMMSLGHEFTIAMLDVDHFKRFNDTYGHDTGDHVLKMVAAKLWQVRSGGRAFRYGGEEFALVFPSCNARRVLRELEALRARVAGHSLALRDPQRPAEAKSGRSRRAGAGAKPGVSVTVSIGLAESNDTHRTPDEVLQAADRALYRAKEKGRNRVSR